jgi:hypothetical protein
LNEFGQFNLQLVLGTAEMREFRPLPHRGHQPGVAMTEDQGTPGKSVINELVAIHIGETAPLCVPNKEWNRGAGTERAAYPSRQGLLASSQQLC